MGAQVHQQEVRACNWDSSLTAIEKGISDNLREQVVGIVLPENKASVTVLLKVGFRWKENLELFGFNVEKYTL